MKVKLNWVQSRLVSLGLLFVILHTPLDHLIQWRGLNYHLSAPCFKSLSLAQTLSVPDNGHAISIASWAASPRPTTGNVLCPKLASLLPPYKRSPSIFLILDRGTNIYSAGNLVILLVSALSLLPKIQILFLLLKYFWNLSILIFCHLPHKLIYYSPIIVLISFWPVSLQFTSSILSAWFFITCENYK